MDKLTTGTLTPANGRTYKKALDVKADFLRGYDFKSPFHQRYCSIRDFEKGAVVELRYGPHNEKSTCVTV